MNIYKLLSILFICMIFFGSCDDSSDDPVKEEFEIAALVPLTGNLANHGPAVLKALQYAVEDLNKEYISTGKSIKLVYDDDGTDQTTSENLISSYIARDIRIIIGPMTSAVLTGVKDAINASNSILISQSSTSPDLAIVDDNIFRVIPNDNLMAKAIADKMWADGIKKVFLINREDVWGFALNKIISDEFKANGGEVLVSKSYFSFRASEYQEIFDEISPLLDSELPNNASQVAIQISTLDEGLDLMDVARLSTNLDDVRWYGSEGISLSNNIFDYTEVIQFARQTKLSSPMYSIVSSPIQEELAAKLKAELGYDASAFALLSYDAMYAAGALLIEEGEAMDIATLRTKLSTLMNGFVGVTGSLSVNTAGDREIGNYDFWKISDTESSWIKE